jgi:hypothetical protein
MYNIGIAYGIRMENLAQRRSKRFDFEFKEEQ